jgi:hypothetical protein
LCIEAFDGGIVPVDVGRRRLHVVLASEMPDFRCLLVRNG